MSEPRRSTRARAREEAAPAPETPKETPVKGAKSTLKRKRTNTVVKDSTPSTPITEAAPQPPRQTLPLRILEGQPLPTLPEPQPLELPTSDWQDIQQSGVLGASLERSRGVWISGVNFRVFHKYFTQPKKPADRTEEDKAKNQRQKDLLKNFPELGKDINNSKDAIEVQAQLVIEPHTFPIRLYAPREIIKHTQKKPTPVPAYGSWPNHSQPQHGQPNQYTQYNNHGQPVYQHKPPPPRPPPPKPVQKAPQPSPSPASTPAPDPVIHALAQRAGTDPELKAVMKIVANGSASKQQLEFFQNHINELTAMLAKQKEDPSKAHKPLLAQSTPSTPKPALPQSPATARPLPPPTVPKPSPSPAALTPTVSTPSVPKPANPSPAPAAPPVAALPPPPRPVQPAQPAQSQQPLQQAPKPYSPMPPHGHMQQPPPLRPPHPSYPNNYNQPHQQYHPPRQMQYAPPPPPTGYRPLVFSFEEGSKDLLHFPSYSFMEWLPNMSGAKFSFLVTKMKPKPEPEPVAKPPSTPAPKPVVATPQRATPSATPGPPVPTSTFGTPNAGTPAPGAGPPASATPSTAATFVPPPRIEDFDEKNDVSDVEFYQPVTVLLLTENNDIRQALLRAIRPPDVVEKYMEEVFDKCKRAEETYLAFRLPRDGDIEVPEKRVKSGDETPIAATPTQDFGFGGGLGTTLQGLDKKKAGRPRKSFG